jgi:hypothetical protein
MSKSSRFPMGLIPSASAIARLRSAPPLSWRVPTMRAAPPQRGRILPTLIAGCVWTTVVALVGAIGYLGVASIDFQREEPQQANVQEDNDRTIGPVGPKHIIIRDHVVDVRLRDAEQPADRDIFPRRLLAIGVSEYLYLNRVGYGPRGRDTHVLLGRLARALQIPDKQVFELSDAAPNPPGPRPPLRETVAKAIHDFAATSRAQDRIILLFSGHAVDVDGEAYLVPLDGELADRNTLVPLKQVYAELKACKARQKILILDVCRFDPSRGSERADGGAMSLKFEALLTEPPAGVQVWTACSAGEHSYDESILLSGSVFLSTMIDALTTESKERTLKLAVQKPTESIPIAAISARINRWTTEDAKLYLRRTQTPKLYGEEKDNGAAFKLSEPAAVAVQFPKIEGNFFAPKELIDGILRELADIPPVKTPPAGVQPLRADNFPGFTNKVMKDYHPGDSRLRQPVAEAIRALNRHKETFREEFPVRNIAQLKAMIRPIQVQLAASKLELDEALMNLLEAENDRNKEPSKRWQATYDYVKARLLMRAAYTYEYAYLLSDVQQEALPELQPNHIGWRLASRETMQCKQQVGKEARAQAKEAKEILEAMAAAHKGTPYEVLAKREAATALGLEWQPLVGAK